MVNTSLLVVIGITNIEKGELLEVGLQGRSYETKKGIVLINIMYLAMISFSLFATMASLFGRGEINGSPLLAVIVFGLISVGSIYAMLFIGGQQIDGIYQNGLTHRNVGWVKKLQGKYWIPWHEVKLVEFGLYSNEPGCEYLRVYTDTKDTWRFHRRPYDRHSPKFYPLLYKMLAELSPQAQWVRKDVT